MIRRSENPSAFCGACSHSMLLPIFNYARKYIISKPQTQTFRRTHGAHETSAQLLTRIVLRSGEINKSRLSQIRRAMP